MAISAEIAKRAVETSSIPEQVSFLPVDYFVPSDMQAMAALLRRSCRSTLLEDESSAAALVTRLLDSSSALLLADANYIKDLVDTAAASSQQTNLLLLKDLIQYVNCITLSYLC